MRNRNKDVTSEPEPTPTDTDSDQFLTSIKAIRRVLHDGELDDVPIERIDIRVLANGEVTWRVWAPRDEEFSVGYLAPEGR